MEPIDPRTDVRLLARLGISADAESVWRILIAEPDIDRQGLAARTALSGVAISTALDSLRDAQLVRSHETKTGVIAIDPALAVETHIARAERQMAEQADEFAIMRAHLPSLAREFTRGRSRAGNLPGFEVITSVEEIRREAVRAADRVQANVRHMDHDISGDYEGVIQGELDLLGRGIRDRLITSAEALADPGALTYFEQIQRHGHDTRIMAGISTRLMIFDREIAIFAVDPENMHLGAFVVRVQGLVDMLIMMYDHMWDAATPAFVASSDDDAPTGRTARVLEFVTSGATDETIARALGVANRTVRREVSELKTGLGVTSRAEIAAAAVRRGWL